MSDPAAPGAGGWHADWGRRKSTPFQAPKERRRLPRWAMVVVIVGLIAGGIWLWMWATGPSSFCNTTVSIRHQIADASEATDEPFHVAVAAVAAERAPGLTEQAEGLSGSSGTEAEAIAAALGEVAASDSIDTQREPLQRFVELDNEFRRRHCNSDQR